MTPTCKICGVTLFWSFDSDGFACPRKGLHPSNQITTHEIMSNGKKYLVTLEPGKPGRVKEVSERRLCEHKQCYLIYNATDAKQKYCSKVCSKAANRARRDARRPEIEMRHIRRDGTVRPWRRPAFPVLIKERYFTLDDVLLVSITKRDGRTVEYRRNY